MARSQQQARCVPIEPLHEMSRTVAMDQRICKGARGDAVRRVADDARRLVHDEDVVILVNDGQGYLRRGGMQGGWPRPADLDPRSGSCLMPRLGGYAILQDGGLGPQPAEQSPGHAHPLAQQDVQGQRRLGLARSQLQQPHGVIVRVTLAPMRQVFVTGAAGCVGHYVLEHLLLRQDCHPVVLLRDPSRLRADLRARVTWIEGDLARPEPWLDKLEGMDEAILVATSWGGALARQVNVAATHAILRSMPRARRIVYFSTASMLEPDGSFDQAAASLGTDYIRTKHEAITTLEDPRVVPVFPTVVLGGDDLHPRSAATAGLPGLRPWRALLARLAFDGLFHVIHASDLARFAVWLLDHPEPPGRLVVGLPALTVREVAQTIAARLGARPAGPWDWTPLIERLPRLIPWKFTSWDLHCLARRQFRYPVVDLAGVTGRLDYPDLASILASDPRLSVQQVPSERK